MTDAPTRPPVVDCQRHSSDAGTTRASVLAAANNSFATQGHTHFLQVDGDSQLRLGVGAIFFSPEYLRKAADTLDF